MSTPARQARRAAFGHTLLHYHNSFAGDREGVFEHSPGFIANLVEADQPTLAQQALRLDPRLTSTDAGAVAFAVAKAVSMDKQLAPDFVDVEIVESMMLVYFESKAQADKIKAVLGECGRVGIITKPQSRISDTVVADLWTVAIEPAAKVAESVVAEMRARFLPKVVENKPAAQPPVNAAAPAAAPVVTPDPISEAHCKLLGLDLSKWSAAAIAAGGVKDDAVRALFAETFGSKSVEKVADAASMARSLVAHGYAGPKSMLPEAATAAVDAFLAARASLAEQIVAGTLPAPRYDAVLDDLAVALDAVLEDAPAVYGLFFDRVADLRTEAVDEARRAALIDRIRKTGASIEEHQAVIAKALRAIARTAMVERGLLRTRELAEARASLAAYLAAATKVPEAAPAPADPLACVVDAALGVDA